MINGSKSETEAENSAEMNQEEFAIAFGLSFATVRNWESPSRGMPTGPSALLIDLIYADPFLALRVVRK